MPPPPQAGDTGAVPQQQAPQHPVQIALAVLLAGTIPQMIVYVVLVVAVSILQVNLGIYSPYRADYLRLYFLVHVLLPLALGYWAGAAWPGKHTSGIAVLAVLAGVTEAVALWIIVTFHSRFFWWPYNLLLEDRIAPIATVTLFMAGGLTADLVEQWRSLRSRSLRTDRETMRAQGGPIEAPTQIEERKRIDERKKMMLLLIQSLGPAALTLIGTIITVTR